MQLKTNSSLLFNAEEAYNFFFLEYVCRISLDFPMPLLYLLDSITQKDDEIILFNVNQENNLFDEEFVCNGTKSIELDNLSHVYV